MFQAILEATATFGPIVFLMLSPVLLPLTVEIVGAIADRRKLLNRTPAVVVEEPQREFTRAELTKAA